MRTTLYLMVGYPGAGKTTISKLIHQLTGAVHIWGDKERLIRFEHPRHTESESQELYGQLNTEVSELLRQGRSVVFDTNFSFRKDRDHMRKIAEQNRAECRVIWVTTPRAIARKRAVEESENKPTRLWGNMLESVFNRLAGKQQDPDADEHAIQIRGIGVTEQTIRDALDL